MDDTGPVHHDMLVLYNKAVVEEIMRLETGGRFFKLLIGVGRKMDWVRDASNKIG